jgi:hypothetical protein
MVFRNLCIMNSKKLNYWMLLLIIAIVIFGFDAVALAQKADGGSAGGEIFADAACGILEKVLIQDFGALITVIAGSLAILASVTGSFRGAWALLFVSVGTFVYPATVELLFPGMCG